MERHGLAHGPAEEDEEGGDEEGDLHGGADGDADGEVHLVLVGDDDGRDVLCCVADDGDEDQTDEGLGDAGALDDGADGADEVVGADGDEDGDEDEDDGGGVGRKYLAFLLLASFFTFTCGFFVEEAGVGLQLKEEVEDVEDKEDDRSAVRQDQDVVVSRGLGSGESGVKRGGDDERGGRYGHERRHG